METTGPAAQNRSYSWNYDCTNHYDALGRAADDLGIGARIIGSNLLEVRGPQAVRKLHIPDALRVRESFGDLRSGRAGHRMLSRIFVSLAQMSAKEEDFARLGIGSQTAFSTWWIRDIGPFYTKISDALGRTAHNALLRAAANEIGVRIAVDLEDDVSENPHDPPVESRAILSAPLGNVIPISQARSMRGR